MANEKVNVLCIKWGTYYSADYVNRLYATVCAHLRRLFRFVCMTDRPEAIAGYAVERRNGVPVPLHLRCRPAPWVKELWENP